MRCPHCENEIPGTVCDACRTVTPDEGAYCMGCGALLDKGDERASRDDGDLDLENRMLCPDGTCIGIVVDGVCTECGKKLKDLKEGSEEERDSS